MNFEFGTAKLIDRRGQLGDLRHSLDPVAIGLAAHLIALATRRKPDRRYKAKLGLLLPLYPLHGKLKELREIQEVIDWLLPLPPFWQRRLTMDIDDFFEEHEKLDKNSLNYLLTERILQRSWAEIFPKGEAIGPAKGEAVGLAKGEAVGQAKGLRQGKVETLKLQLAVQFGPLDERMQGALDRASPAALERLAIALLDADSAEGALRAAGLRV